MMNYETVNPATSRTALEAAWLLLTRHTLPAIARTRRWPVSADHCFMRILLDAVHGERWDNVIRRRPAYAHIDTERLAAAVALGQRVAAGEADLWELNARSLAWRGKD
ncbi:MAG: GCN5-related N-acetyltransferase [Sphingorhabdus sp.]